MNPFLMIKRMLALRTSIVLGLPEASMDAEPFALFEQWFEEAKRYGFLMPEAMALATATTDGRPSARMVLLKGVDEKGFVFYTNYDSRKGRELAANPNAALIFHWNALERSIRIEGHVERVSAEASDAYFNSRYRRSRIGARISRQSRPLASKAKFHAEMAAEEKRFEGEERIPRPEHWGGFRVVPSRIEFWQGRPNRLHDRIVFQRMGGTWRSERLYP